MAVEHQAIQTSNISRLVVLKSCIILLLSLLQAGKLNARESDSSESTRKSIESDRVLRAGNYRNALKIAEQAYETAQQGRCNSCIIQALHAMANAYYYLAEYPQARQYYTQAIQASHSINYLPGLITNYTDLGLVYFDLGDYVKALELISKGDKYADQLGNDGLKSMTLNSLGITQEYLGNLDLAESNYLQSLKIRLKTNDSQGLGYCYNNLGSVAYKKGQFEKALTYHQIALDIRKAAGESYVLTTSLNNLGLVYGKLGKRNEAEIHFKQSLQLSEKSGDNYLLSETYRLLGALYLSGNNIEQSELAVRRSLQIATSIGASDLKKEAYFLLADIYQKRGNYQNAFVFLKQYTALKDSILGADKLAQSSRLQTGLILQSSKDSMLMQQRVKEKALTKQTSRSEFLTILILILVFILLFSLWVSGRINFSVFRQRQKAMKFVQAMADPGEEPAELMKSKMSAFLHCQIPVYGLLMGKDDNDESFIEDFTRIFEDTAKEHDLTKVFTLNDELIYYRSGVSEKESLQQVIQCAFSIINRFKQNNHWDSYIGLLPNIGIHQGEVYGNIMGITYPEHETWVKPIQNAALLAEIKSSSPGNVIVNKAIFEKINSTFSASFTGEYTNENGQLDRYYILNTPKL